MGIVHSFRSIRWWSVVAACLVFCALARPAAARRPYSAIRSVAVAPDYALLAQQIPAMKAAGYNTVWLGLVWADYERHVLPAPAVYSDQKFAELRQILDLLRASNMEAILGLDYVWGAGLPGAPEGIDAARYLQDPAMLHGFDDYVAQVMTRIQGYADMVHLLVFTEGSEPGPLADYHDPAALCSAFQSSLGSLPSRLPASLRSQFSIGYHDYSLISLNWGNGCSPIRSPIAFDFVSMVQYNMEPYTTAQIAAIMDQRAGWFHALYPTTPLILGEFGTSHCPPNSDAIQASLDGAMSQLAIDRRLGFNMWAWNRLAPGGECAGGAPGFGIYDPAATTPAIAALRPVLAPHLTAGGVVTAFEPWAVWLAGQNLTSSTRIQLSVAGSRWGGDLALTLTPDWSGASFSLPSDIAPLGCNRGQWCNVSAVAVDAMTGLASPALTLAVPPVPAPVITGAGVTVSFEPWAVWVVASGLRWSDRIQFYDVGGAPWGTDRPIALAADGSWLSTQLPSDSPPSRCNQLASCDIEFAIIDGDSGQPVTARRALTLPH
jgi:hypothetical protein